MTRTSARWPRPSCGVNSDLGFSPRDRQANLRRGAELARLMNQQGLITIAAFVSPLDVHRQSAREVIGPDDFLEIYCDAPQQVCEERDQEGLYSRAREGELRNVTGIDSPYEPPENADLVLDTSARVIDENVARVMEELVKRGFIPKA